MSYLQDLQANLKALPESEISDAMLYYEQYFYEGQLTDGQAVSEFGTPKNLARRLVAESYMDEARDVPEENQKSGNRFTHSPRRLRQPPKPTLMSSPSTPLSVGY